MQSVPITTQVVGSNLDPGEAHSIQHYVMKFISDLRQIQYLVVISITVSEYISSSSCVLRIAGKFSFTNLKPCGLPY